MIKDEFQSFNGSYTFDSWIEFEKTCFLHNCLNVEELKRYYNLCSEWVLTDVEIIRLIIKRSNRRKTNDKKDTKII